MVTAKEYLLETDLNNKEIAFLIGYSDENSFFRAYKQAEGLAPTSQQLNSALIT